MYLTYDFDFEYMNKLINRLSVGYRLHINKKNYNAYI